MWDGGAFLRGSSYLDIDEARATGRTPRLGARVGGVDEVALDLVDRARPTVEAFSRRDLDSVLAYYRSDAVWDNSPIGIGVYEGHGRYASSLRIGF
jgi:hypothetical protein